MAKKAKKKKTAKKPIARKKAKANGGPPAPPAVTEAFSAGGASDLKNPYYEHYETGLPAGERDRRMRLLKAAAGYWNNRPDADFTTITWLPNQPRGWEGS